MSTTGEVGRPTDYKPEYCDRIKEMGKRGLHVYQIALALECSLESLYRWADKYPEFSEAFTCARAWSKGAMLNRVDECTTNPDAQPKLLEMKATFLTDYVRINGFNQTKDPIKQLELLIEAVNNGERSPRTAEMMANAIEKRIKAEQELELKPLLEKLQQAIAEKK